MNENRIVESDKIIAADHRAIATIGMFCVGIALFLLIVLSAMIGPKAACIALFILIGIAAILWLATRSHERWMIHNHHVQEIDNQQHHIDMTKQAISKGYSVHFEHPDGRKVILTSPLTIPNGPVTIKEMNWGQEQLPAPLPIAPPFSSIASQIRPGHLFLGQGIAGPIWGDITDLLSTLDVGRPGTGKSTLLRNVCGHVLIIGGKPIIFDPHGSILDSLGNQFECAESPRDIVDSAKGLDIHLTKRLQARRAGKTHFKPVLLLVDEMPIIASMAMEALPAIRRIVLEGRKVGMFALISGQGVPASILGGTLVRDAMASRYVFCTSPAQARMAGLENEIAKSMMAILESAGPGKAVLATSNRRPEIVAIPDTTTDDIRLLLARKSHSFIQSEEIPSSSNGIHEVNEMNSMNEPVKLHEYTMNIHEQNERFMNIQYVSDEEKAAILGAAQTQMNMTGKVTRTKVRDDLGWNNAQFPKIKQVLDEEGL